MMQDIISKTGERYLVLDYGLFLVPAANLNRSVTMVPIPLKA
ncbi:hypothetical protein [Qingshengfaniella alkalisoli]|nr:hypothetical protein [Qingshengfaniella alkalisoli]